MPHGVTDFDFLFANNASSLLLNDITSLDVTLELPAGDGDLFPDPIYGEQFAVTLRHPSTGEIEIMWCRRKFYGDSLEVVRGREGTAAIAFPANTVVAHQITAGTLEYLRDL